MKCKRAILAVGILIFLSSAALATSTIMVKDYPDGGTVTLQGTVEDFSNAHSLLLRDLRGTIKIDLSSTQPITLQDGEKINVTGTVHHTLLGTDIIATTVSEDKGVGQEVGEAIDSLTGQDVASGARVVTIQALPATGLVKVNGVVSRVGNSKNFTLKDSTGNIGVTIVSGESASLKKGTEVTVVGNVDKGLLGKSINAIQVDVVTTSAPAANQ